jgi:hypothetical protein
MREAGIETLVRQATWAYTGKQLPGPQAFETALSGGLYSLEQNVGYRGVYYFPSMSSYLERGELQIMAKDTNKRNYWFEMDIPRSMKVRTAPIMKDDFKVFAPNLVREDCDFGWLFFDTSARSGEEPEIYRRRTKDPKIFISFDFAEGVKVGTCDAGSVWYTLLVGANAMFGGTRLWENYHTDYDFVDKVPPIGPLKDVLDNRELRHDESITAARQLFDIVDRIYAGSSLAMDPSLVKKLKDMIDKGSISDEALQSTVTDWKERTQEAVRNPIKSLNGLSAAIQRMFGKDAKRYICPVKGCRRNKDDYKNGYKTLNGFKRHLETKHPDIAESMKIEFGLEEHHKGERFGFNGLKKR